MKYSIARHKKRSIRFIDIWREEKWQIKIYGISESAKLPDNRFIDVAKDIGRSVLPKPAVTEMRYGLGFITIHQAEMFNQIIIDWWERENELRHHVFKAEPDSPYHFVNITVTGEAFCVWELKVIGFERDSWMQYMIDNLSNPDPDSYLNAKLNTYE